jgi:two-component system sensor histidine kinase AgrC
MMKNNSMDLILLGLEIFVIPLFLTLAVKALWRKLKIHDIFNKRYGILIAILVIMTFIIFYVNILMGEQRGFTKENIQINSILFSFYFLVLLVVFFVLTRIVIKENNIKNQQLQYERLQEYTANLEELYTDMQKFRHDYINILSTMSEYIREKDVESLEHYFNDKIMPISQGMRSNNYKLGALKNLKIQEIKGILSSKLIKSQELNIDTVIEVVEPIENINMDSINLCRCLGIVLDNAIDEAQLCENPTIRAAVMKREGSVLIVVANTCRSNVPPLYKIYQKGFSTKGEKRGLGLSNLKEIVAQYEQVILDTYTKDEHFIQELEIF